MTSFESIKVHWEVDGGFVRFQHVAEAHWIAVIEESLEAGSTVLTILNSLLHLFHQFVELLDLSSMLLELRLKS